MMASSENLQCSFSLAPWYDSEKLHCTYMKAKSICVQATDRQREDLPNPLVSITPLHPTLPPPLDERPADSPSSSRRSSASDGSIPRTPPRSNSPPPRAFDDPLFRTLPPPPGVNVRPFPLPSIHRHAHETTDDGTTWSTEYDTDATFGGPSPKFTNSSDFVPWDVTRDWSARDVGAFVRCDLMMQGRGARRHIRVWQKKPDDEGYHSGGTA